MNKFRSRLLFALVSLLVVVLIGLGFLLGQIFKSFYLNNFNDRMEKEANFVTFYVSEQGLTNLNIKEKMATIGQSLDLRITILNPDGSLLHDSVKSTETMNDVDEESIERIVYSHLDDKEPFRVIRDDLSMYYYGTPLLQDDEIQGFVILSSPLDSLRKVYHQIWGLLIGSLGLAFIVILLLGVKITSQYTRPIDSATKVAIELARGNYKARTYEGHHDETGMLSNSINILARNLQDVTKVNEMQQDRLRTLIENMGSGIILIDERGYINLLNRAFKEIFEADPVDYLFHLYNEAFMFDEIITIVEEVFMTEETVRRQLLLSLKVETKHFEVYGAPIIGTNDKWKGVLLVFHDISELKKLEQVRKDFVANVSHELKTPITSIKGFSETLLDGAMKDDQTLESFLTIILKESDRLQNLIQDLLDLSKIEQHGFQLSIQKVDIKKVIDEVLIMLQPNGELKQLEFQFLCDVESVYVSGDISRIKQVFINLVSNAITYTPSSGKIRIELKTIEDTVQVKVSDTGIGINEVELPRIFERFYRVDKDRGRNSGGTGLGLAIVKHIVEAHHGKITVVSKINEGTVFTVLLKK